MIKACLKLLSKISMVIRYIVAPPICFSCKEFIIERSILCKDCDGQLVLIAPKLVQVTSAYNLSIHAICKYDDPLKRMIIAKHYSDHIMFDALADLIWNKTVLKHLSVDCFVPIPLHWTRKVKRGFNQAEILAKRLGSHYQAPIYDMISRVKKTKYQAQLEKTERKDNVSNAFVVKDGFDIAGKHIMLVDDLCTTASTAVQVAKVLAKYKPASISLIVACRAL